MVVFLRGFWCDYCRKQVDELIRLVPAFDRRNIQIIAITTDPDAVSADLDIGSLSIYLDADGAIIRQLELTDPFEFRDVPVSLPATFLLDRNQVVRFHYVGRSPDDRPKPDLLLLAAERLSLETS